MAERVLRRKPPLGDRTGSRPGTLTGSGRAMLASGAATCEAHSAGGLPGAATPCVVRNRLLTAAQSRPPPDRLMPQLSEGRKLTYYLGLGLMVVGLLVFGSVFVTGALQFGDFTDFENRSRSSALRGVVGMALLLLGGVLRTVGARGVAGSGLVLDPKRARRDLEP